MQGLFYREYLNLKLGLHLPTYPLEATLEGHLPISREINTQIKPINHVPSSIQFIRLFRTVIRKSCYFSGFESVKVIF